MFHETHQTAFGWLQVHTDHDHVIKLDWFRHAHDDDDHASDVSRETWRQIRDYCCGHQKDFTIPLNPAASPALTRWLYIMREIKPATTVTYKQFAEMAGHPKASRAAGSACARNPIPLIIPCHRVTKVDGSLGNFGALKEFSPKDDRNLSIKSALIAHEKAMFG